MLMHNTKGWLVSKSTHSLLFDAVAFLALVAYLIEKAIKLFRYVSRSHPHWLPQPWRPTPPKQPFQRAAPNPKNMKWVPHNPAKETDMVEKILATRISRGKREFKIRWRNTQEVTWYSLWHLIWLEQNDVLEDWLDENPKVRKRMAERVRYYGYEEQIRLYSRWK